MSHATGRNAEQLQAWMVERIAAAVGLDAADIDVDAPFIDHGLDSVAALQLTGELETFLGRPLDATLVFEYPTIATLCRHLAT
jgi:acyl carrier protein